MKLKHSILVAASIALLGATPARSSTTILSDNFTATASGTGFGLGSGVNAGINPPTTRMTGTAAGNLRYIQTATAKPATQYDISSNRLRITKDTTSSIGRFTLSDNGASAFDFGPALGSAYATPANPAVYDLKISMRNDATGTSRFSFGISTAEGDATTWDFGVQMYRTSSTVDHYTLQKRVDAASCGGADVNTVMGTTGPNTTNALNAILIHVTDAGAETDTFSSRVQVSLDNGATWIYDTASDSTDLPNGFRFDGAGRVIVFDQAGNTGGTEYYDSFSVTSISSPAPPTAVVWSGAGADDNWSTAANWGGAAPTGVEPLIFDGTTRQANVNDITGLGTPMLVFNNGGFDLTGNAFSIGTTISNLAGVNTIGADISFSSIAPKTWNIASGSELILSSGTTVDVNGDIGVFGGGTLHSLGTINIGQASSANPAFAVYEGTHVIDATAIATTGGYRIGSQPSGAGGHTVLTNGADFSITASAGNFRVGDSANPNAAVLDIDNSTLNLSGSVVLAVSYATGATGVINQNGGVVNAPVTSFNEAGAGTGSYTIKNGTLSTGVIREKTAGGSSSIYFDNATLSTAGGASSAFFSGLDLAQIQPGGLNLDISTDVTIAQALSGPGGIVKGNGASVTLTGANTYTGNTVINSGKLAMVNTLTNGTTVQVSAGAEFGVSQSTAGGTLNITGASFASGSTLSFDFGTLGTPKAPMMKVSNLSVSGPVTINVANGLQLTTGQIVLVGYDGSISGGFQFSLGNLPAGVTATLVNDTANSSIDLNITGVPGFRWTGAIDGNWDGSTPNWLNLQNNSASTYQDGYPVEFLDGAATGNITLAGFPTPAIITVSNNALPYTWSGGGLTVSTIKKFGTSSVTRMESGADVIGGIELNEGTFAVSNVYDSPFTAVLTDVTPNGTFAKQGGSTLTVSSTNNSFDGSVLIQEGAIKIGTDRALGSTKANITIAPGATLDLNDHVPGAEPVVVSGDGVGGQGAIIDSTTGGAVDTNLRDVTMLGDTTLGAPNGGRWDIRVRSGTGPGPGLKGNGYNLTKVGSGSVSIACQRSLGTNTPYWDMNLGDVVINEGALTFAESLTPGNPSKTITVNSGATLNLYDLNVTNPLLRSVFMTDASLTGGGASTDTNVINGTITVTGADNVKMDQCAIIVNGAITGSGSLFVSANNPGRLYLNGANNFSGDLTVSNAVLGGSGSMTANLVMQSGTLAPGRLDLLGTFSVSGNATLAGTTSMEIDHNALQNSDQLNVGGTLMFGGTLQVVLGVSAAQPQAGDVYHLFNKGGGGSFASVVLPDLTALPGGLAWDTSNLAANGSISVTGTAAPPSVTTVSVSGTNLVFSGTGGIQGNNYVVLTSTNIALPIANWTPVVTNQFGAGGSFAVTNSIDPNVPASFFELQLQ